MCGGGGGGGGGDVCVCVCVLGERGGCVGGYVGRCGCGC